MSILVSTEFLETLATISTPYLDLFFKAVTVVFAPTLLLVYSVVLFWVGNKKEWSEAFTFLIILSFLTIMAKDLFDMSRPSVHLRKIAVYSPAFPSGHATLIAGATGWLIYKNRTAVSIIAGIFVSAAVMLSRLFLGVHYPRDVLGGAAFGILVLLIWIVYYRRFKDFVGRLNERAAYIVVALVIFLMLLYSIRSGEWALESAELAGLLSGFLIGKIVFDNFFEIHPFHTPLGKKDVLKGCLRCGPGLIVALGLMFLEDLFFTEAGLVSTAAVFTLFVLIGLHISLFLPLLSPRLESIIAKDGNNNVISPGSVGRTGDQRE